MAPPSPGWGIGLVLATTVGYALVLRFAQRLLQLKAEQARKLFHLGGGAIALALPWIFDRVWPVVVLGGIAVTVFLLLRYMLALKAGFGQIIHAVPRESAGELWFLAGVAIVFWVAHDNVLYYSIAILTLALADTTAAMIGMFYGQHRFGVAGDAKSAEGSSAFLLMAFLCVHVPLLLFSDVGRPETLLVSGIIAILLMLAEAIAWRGIDNLVVPVMVMLLLDAYGEMGDAELILHLAAVISLGLFVFVYRKHTTLSGDALLGVTLVGYSLWALADWRWLIAPLTLFTTYTILIKLPDLARSRPFHAPVMLAISVPPVLIAGVHRITETAWLFFPFNATIAASMALICSLHRQLIDAAEPAPKTTVISTMTGLLVLIPTLLVVRRSAETVHMLGATLLTVIFAAALFNVTGQALRAQPERNRNWLAFPATIGSAVLISFAGLHLANI